jgi:protocatechuate 3,4-dioxygenase alpha subunit
MNPFRQTPSQTIGPFFAYGLAAEQFGYNYNSLAGALLVQSDSKEERICIVGRIYDGQEVPVSDALVEIRQADAQGNYHRLVRPGSGEFSGFGRMGTGSDPDMQFRFITIKPGSTGTNQDPHIDIILFLRGSLRQYYTRLYFSDESESNEKDDVFSLVPTARRETLIARHRVTDGMTEYHFDIHLQGEKETVFFDLGM